MIRHHLKLALDAHKRKLVVVIVLVITSIGSYLGYYRYFGALPQSTINLFQNLAPPLSTDRIIVFSPHQDDETLGAGAYMANAIESGASVYVVFATDGNHHGLATTRATEATAAAGILGMTKDHLIFYNYADTKLSQSQAPLEQSITDTIHQLHPNIVMVTDPVDVHPDHKALGQAVEAVAKKVDPNIQLYTFIIHFPRYPRPEQLRPSDFLLPPISLIAKNRQWLRFDVSSIDLDKKERAILQYRSQLRTPILHTLMLSFVRQNELFSRDTPQ